MTLRREKRKEVIGQKEIRLVGNDLGKAVDEGFLHFTLSAEVGHDELMRFPVQINGLHQLIIDICSVFAFNLCLLDPHKHHRPIRAAPAARDLAGVPRTRADTGKTQKWAARQLNLPLYCTISHEQNSKRVVIAMVPGHG